MSSVNDHQVFLVSWSEPGKPTRDQPGRNWRSNQSAYVVTTSVQRAVALVLERHPEARIWQASHKTSFEHLIIDPEEAP